MTHLKNIYRLRHRGTKFQNLLWQYKSDSALLGNRA